MYTTVTVNQLRKSNLKVSLTLPKSYNYNNYQLESVIEIMYESKDSSRMGHKS